MARKRRHHRRTMSTAKFYSRPSRRYLIGDRF